MQFIVYRPEVHISHVKIDALNKDDARNKVMNGDGEEIALEYSHTIDETAYGKPITEWKVEELS